MALSSATPFWDFFQIEFNTYIYPYLFWISFVFLFLNAARNKACLNRKSCFLILIFFVFILLQTPVSPSDKASMEQLILLYPVPQIIIAAGLVNFSLLFSRRILKQLTKITAISLILILTVFEVYGINKSMYYADETGGCFPFSFGMYGLADYLKQKKYYSPIIIDWGIDPAYVILGGGGEFVNEKRRDNLYDYSESYDLVDKRSMEERKTDFIDFLRRKVHEPDSVFCLIRGFETLPRSGTAATMANQLLEKIAKEENVELIEEKKFFQKDGSWIYTVYSTKK